MKIFLFSYPIRPYCEEGLVGSALRSLHEKGHDARRLGEIIARRYRGRGYQVWWLCFGLPGTEDIPDLTLLSPYLGWEEADTFISCDVSFHDHVKFEQYPNTERVLDMLPPRLKRLVLGGFHQGDCVEKIARAATKRGIPTLVDEDTTEMFFFRTSLRGQIPLIRPLCQHVRELLAEQESDVMRTWILERRRNKPWFAKP